MPTAEQYMRPEVLSKVKRFDLKAKFLVEGFISGLHRSPFKGFSSEFSDHRRYVAGDDPKDLDWKVYARTGKYYVKRFHAETNMECHLVVDASGSMGYGTTEVTKLEYAMYMSAALANIMIAQQDAVGLVTFGDRIKTVVPCKSKRKHVVRVLKELCRTEATGETALPEMLHAVAELISHRGLVVLMSDLLAEPEEILQGLSHLKHRGHEIIIFHILDAAEAKFPFSELTRFEDIETGDAVVTNPLTIKASYLEQLQAFVELQ